jgi:hypothetical protein
VVPLFPKIAAHFRPLTLQRFNGVQIFLQRRAKFSEGTGERERNWPMKNRRMLFTILLALACFTLPRTALAQSAVLPPNPIVSSIFVPIEGDIIEPGTTNLVHLGGEIHVITQVTFSDTGVPSVGIWANLVDVRGTSLVTGITYLGVGAGNTDWIGVSPGPPNIPEQDFDFTLVSLETNPGPPNFPPSPILPVFLRNFVFGAENTNFGELQSVEAGFSQ